MNKFFGLKCFFLCFLFVSGSTNWCLGQFFINGNAKQYNDSCYQLTNDALFQVGSIWNPDKIDLSESFEVLIQLYFGCNDQDGADGIVFGFQPVSTSVGVPGEGIGFAGVKPSIGIEFDTWRNQNLNDPVYDHVAIISSGNNDHLSFSNLAGPVQASATNANIEDCKYHDVRISWDATLQTLEVAFDCVERLTFTGDIVSDYLGGDPFVYWGFTSATGGSFNVHRVCLSYTSFLDKQPDVIMCPGGQVQLLVKGGTTYSWTPAAGLNKTNVPNPIAKPAETTTYLAAITDDCGFTYYNEVTVEIAGDSVFFDLGPDTSFCEGSSFQLDATTPTAIYEWSTGDTAPILESIYPGLYSVTVTRTDTFCTAIDWVTLSKRFPPLLEQKTDTSFCPGDSLLLSYSFEPASYEWSSGEKSNRIMVREAGSYSVIARNECGLARDLVRVEEIDCQSIYFPNIFSPNGDGRNDLWYPSGGDASLEIERVQVFSRWGELLFEQNGLAANEPKYGWNGTCRGKPVLPGTYVWHATILDRNQNRWTEQGTLTLIR